jgi:type I restriction enzyme R subunit
VVATITNEDGSKSGEAGRGLSGGKKIVVCTIQTFPFALKAVQELAATQGKRFAVIADEAHSSQTGEAAAKLKQVLSPKNWQGAERRRRSQHRRPAGGADGGARLGEGDAGITYVAFTATPKAKTLELFGTRPDPDAPAGPDNLPALPCLFHAPGHRGGLHPRRAEELHALQAGLQAGHNGKDGTRRRSSAARP